MGLKTVALLVEADISASTGVKIKQLTGTRLAGWLLLDFIFRSRSNIDIAVRRIIRCVIITITP